MPINYARDMLETIGDKGMTDDLWKLVNNDIDNFIEAKITNHRDRNLLLYLENFINDICYGQNVDKKDILIKSFNKLKNEDLTLQNIKEAIYSVIKKKKLAYPNTSGAMGTNAISEYDVSKWIKALGEIYNAVGDGQNRNDVYKKVTEGWSSMEKVNFDSWMRYYYNNDHEKYGITKSAQGYIIPTLPKTNLPNDNFPQQIEKKPVEKSLEQDKQALISRLDAAVRLLRKFVHVWPDDVWRRMSEMLHELQREIMPLKTTATMRDCIMKTAGKLDRVGFSEGALTLLKVAEGDIASKIERALSGKGPEEGGDLGGAMGDMPPAEPPADMPAPDMAQMPAGDLGGAPAGDLPPMGDAPKTPEADLTMTPPAGVEETLPPPEEPPPAPPEEDKKPAKSKNGENPFDGQNITINDVVSLLEPIAKQLSEREFARSLSKVDMMLDSMNIASHFPELNEIMAKAFELNTYIGTRVEKVLTKLKGGLKGENKNEKEAPPEVDMGEFAGGPKEKVMFEVE